MTYLINRKKIEITRVVVDSDGRTPELAARSLHTRTSTDIYEGWDLDDHRQYMIHNRAPTRDRG